MPQGDSPIPATPVRHHYRRRLVSHIAVLVGLCILPLAGLAVYFLSTGLHREIAVAEQERIGLAHVRQTVTVLQHAVRLAWSDASDEQRLMREIDSALAALDDVEISLAQAVNLAPVALGRGEANTKGVRTLWQEVKAAKSGSADRTTALRSMVTKLHEGIFRSSDRTGLSGGSENEISALTDLVASGLPLHVERLLHMHERLMPDVRQRAWDDGTREAASIFVHQIEEEDVRRLARSVEAALAADARSESVLTSFQEQFPRQAGTLLDALRQLARAIDPLISGGSDALEPQQLDGILHTAFDAAVTGWSACIAQLDALVADQIAEAQRHRNQALWLAAAVSTFLIPVAWMYFRSFMRPVIGSMVNEAVDQRRVAEAARAEADESGRRLRQTQAALDDHCAVTVLDVERKVIALNDRMCRLTGFPREELMGLPFAQVIVEDAQAGAAPWAAAAAGVVWHGNLAHRTRDGGLSWVDTTIFPFLDRSGRPVNFVVIETDITELVRAREVAESAARAKSQFLAMMSHEIRTPMNGVLGFAHLLAETRLDEQQRDYARTILSSGESLLVIINDILDFSKLEAGRTELEKRPVALRLLVEDVLDLLATQARKKNIELVYGIDPEVPEGIVGDSARLRQILLNLAGNAVKFTATGHVEIAVEWDTPAAEDRRLVFHIRDTGIGIPPERLDRLFKAFSQVDASVTRTYGGTGLGLAISRRLVTLMGGDIGVTSTPGMGSDFYFTLPAIEADVTAEIRLRSLAAREEMVQALEAKHVLVVDDLPPNQRLLETILSFYGATTRAVRSAAEARGALERESFDLAILDYLMPGLNGIDLAREIRGRPETQNLPLILVASAQPEQAERPLELFDSVLLKPVRSQPLAAAAAKALLRGRGLTTAPFHVPAKPAAGAFAQEHPLRLLVTDDNPVNLKVIGATLRSLGYEPELFNEAEAALGRLRAEKFDLILMDVQMPGVDGHEATRRLRAGAAGELNRATRVVALTAGAMAEERAACLAAGMDDFMAKPVPRAELLAKLAAA